MLSIKRFPKLSIAIPASLVSDIPHLREKTYRVGQVGRAAAIFRVDEIIVYPDLSYNQSSEINFIKTILNYMDAPQYLRKYVFALQPELKYAGILHPLRTLHHPTAKFIKNLKIGEFREGVVISTEDNSSNVDIGVERYALLEHDAKRGKRATVKVVGFEQQTPIVALVKSEEIKLYWGYHVTFSSHSLGLYIKEKNHDLVLATSKYGESMVNLLSEIRGRWSTSSNVLVTFGSPTEGLREILKRENMKLKDLIEFNINMIPLQGTETVRTEEAIYISLGALNLLMG